MINNRIDYYTKDTNPIQLKDIQKHGHKKSLSLPFLCPLFLSSSKSELDNVLATLRREATTLASFHQFLVSSQFSQLMKQ